MKRNYISETKDLVGQMVSLYGWVSVRRDHGKIIFIDLRDRSGLVQIVFTPSRAKTEIGSSEDLRSDLNNLYELASQLRSEWVVHIEGKVKERPEKMINSEIETGQVEIEPIKMEVLNKAQTPPFPLDIDGLDIGEEHRMQYRYIDLRRDRMRKNMFARHNIIKLIRDYLNEKDFYEIETPILTKSTPEGARDYVVPSRLYSGKFFALPQSPQQYKQLLMVGGIEKYFQIARCFRDEDTRGDRQPEFTQLDLEMSFIDREDVMKLNEELLIEIVKKLYPNKKIQETPFPRLKYHDVVKKYNIDRPDLRNDKSDPNLLAFCWIINFPFFEKTNEGGWTFTHNPFSRPIPEHMDWLIKKDNIGDIITTQYDVVLNGLEIGGGSIRNHQPEALHKVFEIIGFESDRIKRNFGHMLDALGSGAPPHGGIAWGLDRLISLLQDEPNIREVIAFPKTGDARDLMMDSPSELKTEQLKELHLRVEK